MTFRKLLPALSILLILALSGSIFVYGSLKRKNRTNVYNVTADGYIHGRELLEKYSSEISPSYILSDTTFVPTDPENSFAAYIENAPLAVVCKPVGSFKQLYNSSIQEVHVLQVLKGSKSLEKTNIMFTQMSAVLPEEKILTRSFVNFMKEGDTYLLFLYNYGNNPLYEFYLNVPGKYSTDNMTLSIPYFNLSDKHNVLTPYDRNEIVPVTRVKYSEVADNEFFCADEATLNRILEFKKDVLNRYLP